MDLLGINRRNSIIAQMNSRKAIALADDKVALKKVLSGAGIAVPETLAVFRGLSDIVVEDLAALPRDFVMKPTNGRKGLGIAIATNWDGSTCEVSGDRWTADDIRSHLRNILTGEFTSSGAHRDTAFIEAMIEPHDVFSALGSRGLTDTRVICLDDQPIQAMLRLPIEGSGGKANLHRGAVGMALSLKDGCCFRAYRRGEILEQNPETGERLIGFEMPKWEEVLEVASASARASGLGYSGADLVLDNAGEVLVLEVNAFPGIEIQNVHNSGLRDLIETARESG